MPWKEARRASALPSHANNGHPNPSESIEGPLLKAARERDGATQSNLVAFPAREDAFQPPVGLPDTESYRLIVDDKDWESEVTRPAGPSIGLGLDMNHRDPGAAVVDLPIAARLTAGGTVIETVDEDLADAVAYAGRLAGLIGDLLGLEGFRALECASKDERVVIYVEEEGGLVAGRVPAAADVGLLRERLGL